MIKTADLSEFVDTYCSTVYQACRRNTPNVDTAWEAYQETFLVLVRRQKTLDPADDWGPWLRETARRCSLAVVRQNRQRDSKPLPEGERDLFSANSSVVDSAELAELNVILQQEFQELSNDEREVLHLVYHEEKSHREIADVLGCPAGSVHSRVDAARDKLRSRLKRRGVELGAGLLLFLFNENASADEYVGVNAQDHAGNKLMHALPTTLAVAGVPAWLAFVAASIALAVGYGIFPRHAESTPAVEQSQVEPIPLDMANDPSRNPAENTGDPQQMREPPVAMPFN